MMLWYGILITKNHKTITAVFVYIHIYGNERPYKSAFSFEKENLYKHTTAPML